MTACGINFTPCVYDRLGVIMDAWATLAAGVISFRILHRDGV
jgi:hypothetical protein